jgi:hypothetical protein
LLSDLGEMYLILEDSVDTFHSTPPAHMGTSKVAYWVWGEVPQKGMKDRPLNSYSFISLY